MGENSKPIFYRNLFLGLLLALRVVTRINSNQSSSRTLQRQAYDFCSGKDGEQVEQAQEEVPVEREGGQEEGQDDEGPVNVPADESVEMDVQARQENETEANRTAENLANLSIENAESDEEQRSSSDEDDDPLRFCAHPDGRITRLADGVLECHNCNRYVCGSCNESFSTQQGAAACQCYIPAIPDSPPRSPSPPPPPPPPPKPKKRVCNGCSKKVPVGPEGRNRKYHNIGYCNPAYYD